MYIENILCDNCEDGFIAYGTCDPEYQEHTGFIYGDGWYCEKCVQHFSDDEVDALHDSQKKQRQEREQ